MLGWSLCLTAVAVKSATRRETGGGQRRHCSPAASRASHNPALLLLLQHPCALTSFSQAHPHWLRRSSSLEIISDYTRWGFSHGIQTSPGLTAPWKNLDERCIWKQWALNKPWTLSQLSKLANLSFQNPKQPLSRLNFAASRRKTNHDLPHCWDGLAMDSPVMQEGVQTLWITSDSSSLVTIPLSTS